MLSRFLPALMLSLSLPACDSEQAQVEEEIHESDLGFGVFRRLTRVEYDNTIRDLLGIDDRPGETFPPDEETLGFDNNASAQNVSPLLAESYMTTGEQLSERADLTEILPCELDTEEQLACAETFLLDFGARAYRRPLADQELQALLGAVSWGVDHADFETGIRLALQAILQSPHFLYRVEVGVPVPERPDLLALTPYEMASRLSYLLWNTMPDRDLFLAAELNQLSTPEEIATQARRLLADPKAKKMMAHFYGQWLELDAVEHVQKDLAIFPGFSRDVAKLLRKETEMLMDDVIWDQNTDIREIFATSKTFRNGPLSAFYGEAGPPGEEFVNMGLDPARRAGILSHGSILATHAKTNQGSPIHRGLFVREQLFCHIMPEPPDDFAIAPPDLDPNLSTRERFRQHRLDPACAGCHAVMDPIGFGFEHFDGVGRYRETENGLPIDASGELTVTDVDGPFEGAPGLAAKLAQSEDLLSCVVSQAFRFAYGRGESEADQHTMEQLRMGFIDGGSKLQELFVQLTQTDAFRFRKRGSGPTPTGAQ
jgi:hypothetical protein